MTELAFSEPLNLDDQNLRVDVHTGNNGMIQIEVVDDNPERVEERVSLTPREFVSTVFPNQFML